MNQQLEVIESTLCEAIKLRKAVSFSYKGQPRRVVEPHLVGTRKGSETRQVCAWWLSGHSETEQVEGWHGCYKLESIESLVIEDLSIDTARPHYVAEADSRMSEVGCYIPLDEAPYVA